MFPIFVLEIVANATERHQRTTSGYHPQKCRTATQMLRRKIET
jgi:hypothetical protein